MTNHSGTPEGSPAGRACGAAGPRHVGPLGDARVRVDFTNCETESKTTRKRQTGSAHLLFFDVRSRKTMLESTCDALVVDWASWGKTGTRLHGLPDQWRHQGGERRPLPGGRGASSLSDASLLATHWLAVPVWSPKVTHHWFCVYSALPSTPHIQLRPTRLGF